MTRLKMALAVVALTAAALAPATMRGASAAQIRPFLFASEYCRMRAAGVSHDFATSYAVRRSIDLSLPFLPEVRAWGTTMRQDVYLGVKGVAETCPEYVP